MSGSVKVGCVRFHFAELFAFCDLHASRVWRRMRPDPTVMDLMMEKMQVRFYDRQGFPIPNDGDVSAAIVWARLKASWDYTVVVKDELPDGTELSTVWLGLDHGFPGAPLFFETMRFGDGKIFEFPGPDGDDIDTLRYASEEEARTGHYHILRLLRQRLGH